MTTLAQALKKLDNSKATDWTENGAPSLTRVQVLMKDSSVTQAQLDEAAGDLARDDLAAGKKVKKAEATRDPIADDDLAALIDPETGRFDLMEEVQVKDKDTGEMVSRMKRKKVYVKNMHVAAAERGFHAGAIRDPGDTFMYTGELGTWMMPADHARVAEIREDYAKKRAESLNPAPVPMTPAA